MISLSVSLVFSLSFKKGTMINIAINKMSWPSINLNRYMRIGKKCFNKNVKDNKYYLIKRYLNNFIPTALTELVIRYL